MSDFKFFRFNFYLFLSYFVFALALLTIPLTTGCSAFVTPMTDEDALKTLRELTKDNKLPPESIVADIENRFSKTKAGALAKLLRARIRFENSDFDGAAQILNTNVFRERTKLADYGLWLRGRDRRLGIEDRLTPGQLAHQALARVGERHDGRGGPGTLGVRDDPRLTPFPRGDHRVRGPEVDTGRPGHQRPSFRFGGTYIDSR